MVLNRGRPLGTIPATGDQWFALDGAVYSDPDVSIAIVVPVTLDGFETEKDPEWDYEVGRAKGASPEGEE